MMNSSTEPPASSPQQLKRQIGIADAVFLGLGSIIGTGVFVSIAMATGISGTAVLWATVLAALVATCNGLSSAQLAANHPVSGGTYEYGYRWLTPGFGFCAGWMFLCAKSASAATAALGFALYVKHSTGLSTPGIATGTLIAVTLIVLLGLRRSSKTNTIMVSISLAALLLFIVAGFYHATKAGFDLSFITTIPASGITLTNFFEATALMFVAYTGYGRIATLGEEIHEPETSIPKAIIITLSISTALYITVAFISILALGSNAFGATTSSGHAPLAVAASQFQLPGLSLLVSIGAATAMLGVLLNLILGLSRIVLAMARRGDLPAVFARINSSGTSPYMAVLLVSAVILTLILFVDIKTTWSFSAFTVLIYYSITNLAALRLNGQERRYPHYIAALGLCTCLLLAFFVEPAVWLSGLLILATGLIWHKVRLAG
jgi:basic amino acid/polyamine antiporter, APA family